MAYVRMTGRPGPRPGDPELKVLVESFDPFAVPLGRQQRWRSDPRNKKPPNESRSRCGKESGGVAREKPILVGEGLHRKKRRHCSSVMSK